MIDFRSDTVTQPTSAMLVAMQGARLGDDVFGDDPTVNQLEEKAAALFGKDAALFCPSGTMTNQIAIKVHTSPGDEVVCDQLAHIYNYEGGGIAMNSGCSVRLMHGDRGRFTSAMLKEAISPDAPHFPRTRLVSIENTCNKGGGSIWDRSSIKEVSELCRVNDLKFHLDGARLFNALIVTGESPESAGKNFDSISICLSKGLGCPIGSLLIGEADFIKQSRRVRKVFGGGMRQVGYIAAAGIYALDHHTERLVEDHDKAHKLADILKRQRWCSGVEEVNTNIVIAHVENRHDQHQVLSELSDKGILAVGFGKGKIRFVTHLDITDEHMVSLNNILD